jgi:DNA polymerase-3 subunit beta
VQVQCPRKDLFEAVQFVGLAVPNRSTLPILSHILLEAGQDTLRLMATDLEVWVERTIPAVVGEQGSFTLPSKMITDILGSLPDGDLTMQAEDDNKVEIKSGLSDYKLQSLDPKEYPQSQELSDATRFSVPNALLRGMIEQVSFAVSTDQTRPILTGILVSYDGDTLRLVATDTHRLAMREAVVEALGTANIAAVVPDKAITLLARMPGKDDESVQMGFTPNKAVFTVEGARLVTQLIEGQFPNYQRVIPSSYTRKWVLAVDELSRAVRRAAIVAKDSADRVIFNTVGEKLIITSRSELGEAYEEVDIAREGDDISVAFNAKYLLDVVSALQSDGLAVELTESLRPVLIKPVDEKNNYQCVIMPMQLP